jgi:hypothetical protein
MTSATALRTVTRETPHCSLMPLVRKQEGRDIGVQGVAGAPAFSSKERTRRA